MWIIFLLISSVFFSLVFILDKYALSKLVKEPCILAILFGFLGLAASGAIYIVYGFLYLSYFNIFLALLAGFLFGLGSIFYFYALKIEEVSRVVPLLFFSTLFIVVFAAVFLGEIFTPIKYLGIFLLIIGSVLISSKKFFKITVNRVLFLMILASLAFAIESILLKYLLNLADFWTVFAYIRLGVAIGLTPIIYVYLPKLIEIVKRKGKKSLFILSLSEIFSLAGGLSATFAVSIGCITLVDALSYVQPFFVLMFTIILSIFFPSILKEKVKKSIVLTKLLAIILIFIGAMLII